MNLDESPLAIVAEVAAIFDRLHIAYVVGGSIASSFYGVPRATPDEPVLERASPDPAAAAEA